MPATSSAKTVTVFEPACNGTPVIDQWARRVVPDSVPHPRPPRSFIHDTRYRRLSSVAEPPSPSDPDELTGVCESIDTVGAVASRDAQRARCACSTCSVPSIACSVSSSTAEDSLAPPQLTRVRQARACAAAVAVLFSSNRIRAFLGVRPWGRTGFDSAPTSGCFAADPRRDEPSFQP